MKLSTLALVMGLSVATAACQTATMAPTPTPAPVATTATEFVPMATSANLFEVESSRLALDRSRDPDVRRFARRMIADHTAAGRRMAREARRAGLTMAARPTLMSEHQAILNDLAAAPAATFDADYVAAQANAHDQSIALFSAYAENGDADRLRRFASNALPTLQEHRAMVSELQGGATGSVAAMETPAMGSSTERLDMSRIGGTSPWTP